MTKYTEVDDVTKGDSSPQEEISSAFHTPSNSLAQLPNLVTSQDSIDVFHDAEPQFQYHSQLSRLASHSPSASPVYSKPRTRHKSSGPSFDCRKITTVPEEDNQYDPLVRKPVVSFEPMCNGFASKIGSRTCGLRLENGTSGCHSNGGLVPHLPRTQIVSKNIYKKEKAHSIGSEIKREFSLRNFRFNHPHPHLFVTSQWQQQSEMCCVYFAYKLFWAVYFTLWSVWSLVGFAGYSAGLKDKAFYLLYLTDWGIWLLAVDTTLQAANIWLHIRKIALEGSARYSKMKSSFKVSWVISNITSTVHVFITLLFWTAIYPKGQYSLTPIVVNTRIVPCIYVVLDTLFSATPRRIFHAYLPMIILTVYGIVTDVYYLAGGKTLDGKAAIYPILDWSKPLNTLMFGSGLILIAIPLIHVTICVISGFRVRLWRSLSTHTHNRYEPVKIEDFPEEKV